MSSQENRRMTWADFMRQAHERPLPREILDDVARIEAERPEDEDDDDMAPSATC
jgi:hypothetical protein